MSGSKDVDASDLSLSASDRNVLGSFRSLHPPASRLHKINIAIAAGFTLAFAVPAVAFLYGWLSGQPGNQNWIGVALLGSLALLPGIALFFLVRKLWWRLYLFDNGFVFARGSDRVVLWTELKYLIERQDVVAGIKADRWLRVILMDGGRFTIDSSYKDFAAFADALRNNVTRVVLDRAAAALPKGESVPFGKLNLSQAGLEREGKAVEWPEVHSIAIEPRVSGNVFSHAVVIYRKGTNPTVEKVEWYAKPIPDFQNVAAFLQLVSRFTTVQQAGQSK